jgi:hypothetical protein
MTIKARMAAKEMLEELEAETDAIRESIKAEITFSKDVILALTEGQARELKALDVEIERRRSMCRRMYEELIANEERRVEINNRRMEMLDGKMRADADDNVALLNAEIEKAA